MSAPTGQQEPAAPTSTQSLRARVEHLELLARRQRWGVLAGIAVLGLLIGILVGRAVAPTAESEAREAIEAELLPVALDADAIWSSTSDNREPVSEALVALRTEGDPEPVEEDLAAWQQAYDLALIRLAGADMPAAARPVQRQFIGAVALSRDAVDVLGHAATVEDPDAREDLTTEVGRLRLRSEQLFQGARASISDLDGRRADVTPLPSLQDLDRGGGS